jgi:hypothetical protein
MCVFVAFGIQHALRMRHTVICDLPRSTIFFHSLINGTIFDKKVLKTECVFWFSLQLFPETFLILRRNESDMITMYTAFHIKYPLFLSDFSEIWIFSTDFRKFLKYQISWKSFQWEPSCSMWTDRRADMMKLIVAFRNFAKAPKNGSFFLVEWSEGLSCTEILSIFYRNIHSF